MEQNWPILLGIVLTRWDLDLVEQGSGIWRGAVVSLAAMHALQPSPLTRMLEYIQLIKQMTGVHHAEPRKTGSSPTRPKTVRRIHGGDWISGVPGR